MKLTDIVSNADVLCFSHLRWNFVFQRPQHLMTRLAKTQRVFYIEEPLFDTLEEGYTINESTKNVFVIVPQLTGNLSAQEILEAQARIINRAITDLNIKNYWSWYYTPMALLFTSALKPELLIYDCMDELSNFKFAPQELKLLESELIKNADVVFTGGNHLYASKSKLGLNDNIHSFPSSIDQAHFAKARHIKNEPADQKSILHPIIGYFGVIDERMNLELVAKVAEKKPEWQFVFLGPVVKITYEDLPKAKNIHYLGMKSYDELPAYIAGWDVAMLPFALNDATKFISPTKTPEYLAAGKPVISTSITDVVNSYGKEGYVQIADTAPEFIAAITNVLTADIDAELERSLKTDKMLSLNSWDKTWDKMFALVTKANYGKKLPKVFVPAKREPAYV